MSYLYEDDGYMTDLSVSLNASAPNSVYTVTGGTAGSILTAGANGSSVGWTTISADPNLQGTSLNVKGDAKFEGDVIIKGKSINDSLDRIEERLAILRPNEELEAKWENLRGLRKAYMELEAEIIEKEKVWNILKK
jgi:hypothetical protein